MTEKTDVRGILWLKWIMTFRSWKNFGFENVVLGRGLDSLRGSLGLPTDGLIFLFLFIWVALAHVAMQGLGIRVPPDLAVHSGHWLVSCVVDAFRAWSTPLSHPATLKLTFPWLSHTSCHWEPHLRTRPEWCLLLHRDAWCQVWATGAEVAAAYPVIIKKWVLSRIILSCFSCSRQITEVCSFIFCHGS